MTWYYADWSWVHTWVSIAALTMGCVAVSCAIVKLLRAHLTVRHAAVVDTTAFAQASRAEIEREMRGAPQDHNGSRAA